MIYYVRTSAVIRYTKGLIPEWVNWCVFKASLLANIFGRTCMVFPLNGCVGVSSSYWSVRMFLDTPCTYRASHPNGYVGGTLRCCSVRTSLDTVCI